jgi:Cytochrome P460
MKSRIIPVITIVASLAALGGMALAAQDKDTVQVPGGLAFSEFRGYADWQVVAVSRPEEPEDRLNLIVANPVMIDAYRAGVPGNGKPFPDGSKIAKITWNSKQNAASPFPVNVPDTLAGIGFIVKDSTRFSDTGGWGYAQFDYDPASDTFTPNTSLQGNDAKCGAACHEAAQATEHFHGIREEVNGEQDCRHSRPLRRSLLRHRTELVAGPRSAPQHGHRTGKKGGTEDEA